MTDTSVQKDMEDLNNAYNIPSGINVSIVKKEVMDPVVPNLGEFGNLVLNSDCESTNSGTADRPEENVGDPAEIQECLAMNQSLQRQFGAILYKIQSSLDRNIVKQAQIFDEAEESRPDKATKLTSRKSAKLFCLPYFRDTRGLVPPDNEDTKTKTRNRDVTAYVQPPRPWSDEEKTRLLNGVLASALDFVLKKYKAKRDYLKSKLSSPELSDEEKKEMKKNIKEIERQIVKEHKRCPEDLLKEADGNIDWLKVSATDLEGGRSEDDCEIMWNNYLSIFVNKKHFTKAEDAKLCKLAESHELQNWDGVAQLLGTQRTAIQCIERYQTELNKDMVKSNWTPEEDKKLLEIIETVKVGDFIPWNQVLLHMEGRSRHQLITRYERTLKESMDRGPWSKYEDAMLMACVSKFGPKWVKMLQFLPRRTTYHARERYVNHLDKSIAIGGWTREEDVRLGESILKHGYKWSKIATEMPGRTDNMCLTRFKRLAYFLENRYEDLKVKARNDPGFLLKYLPEDETLPSHNCKQQNHRLKSTQSTALKILKKALDNISAPFSENIVFDKTDFSSLNIQLLEKVYKELKRMEKEELENGPPENVDNDDDLTDYEISPNETESEADPDPEELEYEVLWLHKVLETKLQEECASYEVVPLRGDVRHSYTGVLNSNLEYRFYVEYLRKELFLSFSIDIEQETRSGYTLPADETVTQLNLTLHDVVRHFIQPKVSNNEMIILSPNRTTVLGMDRMLASKPRLQRTAHFVEHSTTYIRYLSGSQIKPLCLRCSSERVKKENSREAYQNTVKEMKSKLLVVDRTFDEAAKLETRNWPEEEDACVCEALVRSKDEVDLLMKRFVALFFWPYFLSTVPIPREHDEVLLAGLFPPPRTPGKRRPGRPKKIGETKRSRARKIQEQSQQSKPRRRPRAKRKILNKNENPEPVRKSKRLCLRSEDSFRERSGESEEETENPEPVRKSKRQCLRSEDSSREWSGESEADYSEN